MTTPNALSPCPFCGSDDIECLTDWIDDKLRVPTYWVECHACKCQTRGSSAKELAAEAWNVRATGPEEAEPVATVLWTEGHKDDGYHQRWTVECKPNTLIARQKLYAAPAAVRAEPVAYEHKQFGHLAHSLPERSDLHYEWRPLKREKK
jgi:Lar family restriction alleviation protein